MKIYTRKKIKDIISIILRKYEYLGTSDIGELAFKEKASSNFMILTVDHEYIYCKITQ